MNAAVVTSFENPPQYGTFEDPVPQAGEQLVTVTAAGLHQIVKSLAAGKHYGSVARFPFVPGVDGVGRLEDGTRVYFGAARAPFGTFAERSLAGDMVCIPLPDGLPDAVAAGIANPAMSSWVALDRGSFIAGDNVLILGATGVAGHLAVQVAKRRGAARVVAAGRNADSLAKAKELGADATVSLDQSSDAITESLRAEFKEHGAGVILDYVYGTPAEATLKAVSQKGLKGSGARIRYVNIGSMAGGTIALSADTLRSANVEVLGSGFGSASIEHIRRAIAEFFAIAAKEPFVFGLKTAKLSEVAALWGEKEQAVRLVFEP